MPVEGGAPALYPYGNQWPCSWYAYGYMAGSMAGIMCCGTMCCI